MLLSEEKLEIRNAILDFEQQVDQMHAEFHKYHHGETRKRLVDFSRKKLIDFQLSAQLDRVLFKFQNRKKIWLGWIGLCCFDLASQSTINSKFEARNPRQIRNSNFLMFKTAAFEPAIKIPLVPFRSFRF
jgi:hypothetical protein